MVIRGVAFDLEGTCINIEYAHHQAHLLAAQDAGVELTIESAISKLPHLIGGPHEDVIREIHQLSGERMSTSQISQQQRRYFQQILAGMSIECRPGLIDFISVIKSMGLAISIGSLTDHDRAMFLLKQSGLMEHFHPDTIVLREQVREVKPAPDVFIETAKRMKVSPAEQVVLEDSPNGVRAAVSAGSYTIGMPVYNRTDVIASLVEAGAIRVFMDYHDIDFSDFLANLEV